MLRILSLSATDALEATFRDTFTGYLSVSKQFLIYLDPAITMTRVFHDSQMSYSYMSYYPQVKEWGEGMLLAAAAKPECSYYTNPADFFEEDQIVGSSWFGKTAEALGLVGPVDKETFDAISAGFLPNGNELGKDIGGKRYNLPGCELTFRAPMSVSIACLVTEDRRLYDAVRESVKTTLKWVEEEAAYGFFFEDQRSTIKTQNLAVATFFHEITRQQPDLHVHAVVMNVTRGPNGEWLPLNPAPFYQEVCEGEVHYIEPPDIKVGSDKHDVVSGEPRPYRWLIESGNAHFQCDLAYRVRILGYEIINLCEDPSLQERKHTEPYFEIADIPEKLIEAFSAKAFG